MIQVCRYWWVILLFMAGCTQHAPPAGTFRLHIFQQPQSLDPSQSRSSSGGYLFHNLMRGLYRYDAASGLQPEGGECSWTTPLELSCQLLETHRWSDGQRVTSADYIRAFQKVIAPSTASPRAHLLSTVINAKAILKGQTPATELGVEPTSLYTFRIRFEWADGDFILKLTSTALLPQHVNNPSNIEDYSKYLSTGPYTLDQWKFGQWVQLKPNPHYTQGHRHRPMVRFYVIDKDLTAFRLYEQGELDFLRRVVSRLVPDVEKRPDFFRKPVARFDYIGFGPTLKDRMGLKKALAHGIDYPLSQKILHALGPLGCSSLPDGWAPGERCHKFDKATSLAALPPPLERHKTLTYSYSKLGGEDLALQAEWLQNQWKLHLGLQVEILPIEQGAYLQKLKSLPPDIFRKGVGLDYPSCLAALRTFDKEGPQNYIQKADPQFQKVLQQMSTMTPSKKRSQLCRKGVDHLIGNYDIIPMGKIHFSMMAKPTFKGWKLNSVNQLDLGQLHPASKASK